MNTCENCRFWHKWNHGPQGGECRRHAPKPNKNGLAQWVNTATEDWCGEHEPMPTNGPRLLQVGQPVTMSMDGKTLKGTVIAIQPATSTEYASFTATFEV